MLPILMRKLSDVTMEQRPLPMSEPAMVMEACNPMRDCHVGSVLVTGDDTRGTSYQVKLGTVTPIQLPTG
jgi:hypothetical protein